MATILVVDDQPTNRDLLITLLGYHGHKLAEAGSGLEALEKIREETPDLIVTDILMPNMDGYELVRRIRKLGAIRQPKVVFYSATYMAGEARTLARACGVSEVITKPVEPAQVLKIVDAVLAVPGVPESLPERVLEDDVTRVLSNKLYTKIQEVEELNDRLERRVAERTAELESTNRVLQMEIAQRKKAEEEAERTREERFRMKSEFLSHVSHELRSPLAVAHQFTTILLDRLGGPITTDQQEYLEIMLRNLNQLKYLIDDLLEASRAEVGKLTVKLASVSLAEVVRKTVKAQSGIAAKKPILLRTQIAADLPEVYADASRIAQVLTNLLDNAIKFSPPQTEIHVTAEVFNKDPNFARVSVIDSGPGIEPQDTERIFDRLYQTENPAEPSRQGLGLGLFICKELLHLHGGSIWVESQPGAGSAFHFVIPVVAVSALIAPLLNPERPPAASIALLRVRVTPAARWRSEGDREKSLSRIRTVLERCTLPDLDVLLPLESGDRSDIFTIVARAEEHGCRVLLSRISEQLSRCEDLKAAGVHWSLHSEMIDLAQVKTGRSLDRFTNQVIEYVRERLEQAQKGELSDAKQESIAH